MHRLNGIRLTVEQTHALEDAVDGAYFAGQKIDFSSGRYGLSREVIEFLEQCPLAEQAALILVFVLKKAPVEPHLAVIKSLPYGVGPCVEAIGQKNGFLLRDQIRYLKQAASLQDTGLLMGILLGEQQPRCPEAILAELVRTIKSQRHNEVNEARAAVLAEYINTTHDRWALFKPHPEDYAFFRPKIVRYMITTLMTQWLPEEKYLELLPNIASLDCVSASIEVSGVFKAHAKRLVESLSAHHIKGKEGADLVLEVFKLIEPNVQPSAQKVGAHVEVKLSRFPLRAIGATELTEEVDPPSGKWTPS